MCAFAQQVEVEVGQNRRKTVGVVEIDHGLAEAGAQLVTFGAVWQRASEQPVVVNARQRRRFAMLIDGVNLRGFRQEYANHGLVAFGMKAEVMKGVGVAAFHNRIGLRWKFGHEASLVS